jgi:hypothetical protein
MVLQHKRRDRYCTFSTVVIQVWAKSIQERNLARAPSARAVELHTTFGCAPPFSCSQNELSPYRGQFAKRKQTQGVITFRSRVHSFPAVVAGASLEASSLTAHISHLSDVLPSSGGGAELPLPPYTAFYACSVFLPTAFRFHTGSLSRRSFPFFPACNCPNQSTPSDTEQQAPAHHQALKMRLGQRGATSVVSREPQREPMRSEEPTGRFATARSAPTVPAKVRHAAGHVAYNPLVLVFSALFEGRRWARKQYRYKPRRSAFVNDAGRFPLVSPRLIFRRCKHHCGSFALLG